MNPTFTQQAMAQHDAEADALAATATFASAAQQEITARDAVIGVVYANLCVEHKAKLVLLRFEFLRNRRPTEFRTSTDMVNATTTIDMRLPCMLQGEAITIAMSIYATEQSHGKHMGLVVQTGSVMRSFRTALAKLEVDLWG